MGSVGKLKWVLLSVFLFLYTPIAVLIVMSFNSSKIPFKWQGFSTRWYTELFDNELVLQGLRNTLIVGFSVTILSTVLGVLLAIGITRYAKSSLLEAVALAPAIVPDLALAIGLLALFTAISLPLGLTTVILSHTIFCMAFVAAIVRSRLLQMDPSLEEAAFDLGDSQRGIFFRVTVPNLMPAIIAGALLSFTLSIDEFVITFFTNGPTTPTLPMVIYSMVRFGVTPEINALASLVLLVSLIIVVVSLRRVKVSDSF
ncbi:MAG: ABC transporter permease [Candidatus Nanopelagicales bacterium]